MTTFGRARSFTFCAVALLAACGAETRDPYRTGEEPTAAGGAAGAEQSVMLGGSGGSNSTSEAGESGVTDAGEGGRLGGTAGREGGGEGGAAGAEGETGAECEIDDDCLDEHCIHGLCCPTECPDTACSAGSCALGACTDVSIERCATSHAASVAPSHGASCTATSCAIADSDGDGLNDAWEESGYVDLNCNGLDDGPAVDLSLPGANPTVKDVYLEYDYMEGSHSHAPSAASVQVVVDAFERRGVTLHVDSVHDAIPETDVVTLFPIDVDCSGSEASNFYDLKDTYSDPKRKLVYHYAIYGHYNTCGSGPSCSMCAVGTPIVFGSGGFGEIAGNDLIVSTGAYFDGGFSPTVENEAGLLMHELGHNLGLRHGGDQDEPAWKPNYLSVVNPNYTYTGIPFAATVGSAIAKPCSTSDYCPAGLCASAGTCTRFDYSTDTLPSLDETSLDETVGMGGDTTDIATFDCPLDGAPTPAAVSGPVDWTCDADTDDAGVVSDLNGDGLNTSLTSFDDWAALWYEFQCTLSGSTNAPPPPGSFAGEEVSVNEAIARGVFSSPEPWCAER